MKRAVVGILAVIGGLAILGLFAVAGFTVLAGLSKVCSFEILEKVIHNGVPPRFIDLNLHSFSRGVELSEATEPALI